MLASTLLGESMCTCRFAVLFALFLFGRAFNSVPLMVDLRFAIANPETTGMEARSKHKVLGDGLLSPNVDSESLLNCRNTCTLQ
eukprot:4004393-Amphidinium_carterae.1